MNQPHERTALRYLDALDGGDLEAIAALWEEAGSDPDLELLLCDLNDGLSIEEGPERACETSVEQARELLRRYTTSVPAV